MELDLARLRAQVKGRPARRDILNMLPYLGLDIESESAGAVRVEYSPNRPDYSTEYGIAAGLEGLSGAAAGPVELGARDSQYRIRSRRPSQRPVVMGVCATGARADSRMIGQLMSMQEDLDAGVARARRHSSIGIHDLSAVRFPLLYEQSPRGSAGFAPLGRTEKMSLGRVLSETEQGAKYGRLLGPGPVPVLRSAGGEPISLPPVVNSEATAVREGARSLFVEATGFDPRRVEDALSVAAFTLRRAGFSLHLVKSSPAARLSERRLSVRTAEISSVLGVDVSDAEAARCLRRARLGAVARRGRVECAVPRHRFDVRDSRDLAEEAALGYGVQNLEPRMSAWSVPGGRDEQTRLVERASTAMLGLGYTEVFNTCLVGELPGSSGRHLRVADPKGGGGLLRRSLLPGLAATLASNVHRAYPQRLFETGASFERGEPAVEGLRLGAVLAHADAGFSEAKSAAVAAAAALGSEVRASPASDPMMAKGRAARLRAGRAAVGLVGELAPEVVSAHRLRVPAAGFELDLGLIFDGASDRGAHKSNRADGRKRAGR